MTRRIDDPDELHKIIERLTNENAQWRSKVEAAENIIRRRAPSASGLSLKAAVKTVLDERDKNLDRIEFYREEMQKILRLLLADKADDAKRELNLFLFNNKK